MSSVVLITGVSRYLGARLAADLSADPSIDRIIGVDLAPPRAAELALLGRTEFVRADIRNPLIATLLARARVDTVTHAAILSTSRGGRARASMPEQNVTGTMQLLAACQKSDTVRRVVVKSTTAVYGSSPGDPAVFTEDMHAVADAAGGHARDAVEVENYVRGFARRRPDIVPAPLGFDARLQLLHESDAVEVLRRASTETHPGVYNVAGDGVLTLAQAVRRVGGVRLPVLSPALALAASIVRNAGVVEFSAEQASFVNFGRAVDTRRLREQFGYQPRYTTPEALQSYIQAHRQVS